MTNLTSEQVNQLANQFLAISNEIEKFLEINESTLSDQEKQKLDDLEIAILNDANKLFSLSASLVMSDVQTSLATINKVTSSIKSTYKTLQDIQKAINVATAVVTLTSAIISQNPQAIVTSTTGLADAWNN